MCSREGARREEGTDEIALTERPDEVVDRAANRHLVRSPCHSIGISSNAASSRTPRLARTIRDTS